MKKYDFCVVGATGKQGKIATVDLIKSGHTVLMCGRDRSQVEQILNKYRKKTNFEFIDLRDINKSVNVIKKSGAKIVVNCAEGDWNLNCLKVCIKAKVHSIDLGSDVPMTRDQFALDKTLKKEKLIHITGCGSVPGIGNVMLRHANEKFDAINTIEVGFAWDSNIKKFVVPFSIKSVMKEFTRDAPYLKDHKIKKIKPMDSLVHCYHTSVGEQNEFKVGNHAETYTFHKFAEKKKIKNISFYAGFPEHSMKIILAIIELGLASKKPVKFKGKEIIPTDFLTEVLKRIGIPKGYTEVENLWVFIKGKYKGKARSIMMECIVPPLKGWEWTGSDIDTGMPASIIAQMIFNNLINEPGSYSPEFIVSPKEFFQELAKRKMSVYENGRKIN